MWWIKCSISPNNRELCHVYSSGDSLIAVSLSNNSHEPPNGARVIEESDLLEIWKWQNGCSFDKEKYIYAAYNPLDAPSLGEDEFELWEQHSDVVGTGWKPAAEGPLRPRYLYRKKKDTTIPAVLAM